MGEGWGRSNEVEVVSRSMSVRRVSCTSKWSGLKEQEDRAELGAEIEILLELIFVNCGSYCHKGAMLGIYSW